MDYEESEPMTATSTFTQLLGSAAAAAAAAAATFNNPRPNMHLKSCGLACPATITETCTTQSLTLQSIARPGNLSRGPK